MSAEQNIALVRRYYAECTSVADVVDTQHALAVTDELLSTDFTMYFNNDGDAEAARGLDKHKAFLVEHAHAFHNQHWTVERIVADEQAVACRVRIQATHTETGKAVDVQTADFFTIRNGRLAELRRLLDVHSMIEQMQRTPTQHEAST